MRAVRCEAWGGPETLRIVDLPSRDPGDGEVRIRIEAAGVNFPDVLIIQKKYQVQPELPFTPGAEIAGTVVAAGPGTVLAVGSRVAAYCGQGGFAEEIILPQQACLVLPDAVDSLTGSAVLLAYGTSWYALRDRGALQPGESLLVLGASGGVGLAAVEIGHAMGARVIAACSTQEKLAVATAHDAATGIDYSARPLRDEIRRVLGREGPDVVFDPVGGALTESAFRSIAYGGRHLVIGFASGEIPSLPLNLPLLKSASLVGVYWGGYAQTRPEAHRRNLVELLDWIAEGRLRPVVSKTYRLEETPTALVDMAERRVVGKVVIVP